MLNNLTETNREYGKTNINSEFIISDHFKNFAITLPHFTLTFSTQIFAFYIIFFYTDVMQLPVKAITLIFIAYRIFDALNDLFFGYIMSKFKSKYGVLRQYILWFNIPLAISSILVFTTPNLSPLGKIIYASVTFFIWNTITSILSIAINAILPMITRDRSKRISLNSLVISIEIICVIIVSSSTIPIVQLLGNGNMQTGFTLLLIIFGILSLPLNFIGFKYTKENYEIKQNNLFFIDNLMILLKDFNIRILLIMNCFFWIANTFRNLSSIYFFTYVIGKPEYNTTFFLLTMIIPLLMQSTFHNLTRRWNPELLMLFGLLASFLSNLLMVFYVKDNITMIFISSILLGIFTSIPANLINIVMSENIDLISKKLNMNLYSMLFSSLNFTFKIGSCIAGAIFSALLTFTKYKPNITQSTFTIFSIEFSFIWGSVLGLMFATFFMYLYFKRNKIRLYKN